MVNLSFLIDNWASLSEEWENGSPTVQSAAQFSKLCRELTRKGTGLSSGGGNPAGAGFACELIEALFRKPHSYLTSDLYSKYLHVIGDAIQTLVKSLPIDDMDRCTQRYQRLREELFEEGGPHAFQDSDTFSCMSMLVLFRFHFAPRVGALTRAPFELAKLSITSSGTSQLGTKESERTKMTLLLSTCLQLFNSQVRGYPIDHCDPNPSRLRSSRLDDIDFVLDTVIAWSKPAISLLNLLPGSDSSHFCSPSLRAPGHVNGVSRDAYDLASNILCHGSMAASQYQKAAQLVIAVHARLCGIGSILYCSRCIVALISSSGLDGKPFSRGGSIAILANLSPWVVKVPEDDPHQSSIIEVALKTVLECTSSPYNASLPLLLLEGAVDTLAPIASAASAEVVFQLMSNVVRNPLLQTSCLSRLLQMNWNRSGSSELQQALWRLVRQQLDCSRIRCLYDFVSSGITLANVPIEWTSFLSDICRVCTSMTDKKIPDGLKSNWKVLETLSGDRHKISPQLFCSALTTDRRPSHNLHLQENSLLFRLASAPFLIAVIDHVILHVELGTSSPEVLLPKLQVYVSCLATLVQRKALPLDIDRGLWKVLLLTCQWPVTDMSKKGLRLVSQLIMIPEHSANSSRCLFEFTLTTFMSSQIHERSLSVLGPMLGKAFSAVASICGPSGNDEWVTEYRRIVMHALELLSRENWTGSRKPVIHILCTLLPLLRSSFRKDGLLSLESDVIPVLTNLRILCPSLDLGSIYECVGLVEENSTCMPPSPASRYSFSDELWARIEGSVSAISGYDFDYETFLKPLFVIGAQHYLDTEFTISDLASFQDKVDVILQVVTSITLSVARYLPAFCESGPLTTTIAPSVSLEHLLPQPQDLESLDDIVNPLNAVLTKVLAILSHVLHRAMQVATTSAVWIRHVLKKSTEVLVYSATTTTHRGTVRSLCSVLSTIGNHLQSVGSHDLLATLIRSLLTLPEDYVMSIRECSISLVEPLRCLLVTLGRISRTGLRAFASVLMWATKTLRRLTPTALSDVEVVHVVHALNVLAGMLQPLQDHRLFEMESSSSVIMSLILPTLAAKAYTIRRAGVLAFQKALGTLSLHPEGAYYPRNIHYFFEDKQSLRLAVSTILERAEQNQNPSCSLAVFATLQLVSCIRPLQASCSCPMCDTHRLRGRIRALCLHPSAHVRSIAVKAMIVLIPSSDGPHFMQTTIDALRGSISWNEKAGYIELLDCFLSSFVRYRPRASHVELYDRELDPIISQFLEYSLSVSVWVTPIVGAKAINVLTLYLNACPCVDAELFHSYSRILTQSATFATRSCTVPGKPALETALVELYWAILRKADPTELEHQFSWADPWLDTQTEIGKACLWAFIAVENVADLPIVVLREVIKKLCSSQRLLATGVIPTTRCLVQLASHDPTQTLTNVHRFNQVVLPVLTANPLRNDLPCMLSFTEFLVSLFRGEFKGHCSVLKLTDAWVWLVSTFWESSDPEDQFLSMECIFLIFSRGFLGQILPRWPGLTDILEKARSQDEGDIYVRALLIMQARSKIAS